ncbi:MAG: Flp/Fap pilin component [Sphingomonas bacterium]|jgi:pilus assembly protein Flp/PilA|nr:Flp/Fap pilin component [Sphingomonas bacterium]MDB5718903.1 Flp/Fap pilin component [Sphingomonas bacterium]
MNRVIARLVRNARGATAVEYGLILALVVLAVFAALFAVAATTIDVWTNVAEKTASAGK